MDSTQLSMVFDEIWNSSMMFSSTLTVVQSSGPYYDSLVRALVRGLALCLLHSEAPTLGLLHVLLPLTPVDSRRLLGLCQIVSHGPDSSWDLSSRAPPDSTKRARSTRSIWSWLAFIKMCLTLQVLQHGHYERCSSRNTLLTCLQLGSFAFRKERVSGPSDVSFSSNNKTSSPRPQS